MRVALNDTPQELRRRVADKLESVRGTAMAPNGERARLGDSVCPIYRPDIKGVAYWEFEVAGLKEIKSRGHEGRSSGVGFMLLSAGKHDFPISHWSLFVEPPSRALEARAPQGKVARIVKFDTLAYVAEDAKGTYLTHLGQFPAQILTAATDLTRLRGISTVTAIAKATEKDDKIPPKLTVTKEGVPVPKVRLRPWESWAAAKRGYAAAYKPHLQALTARASDAWMIQDLLAKYGEGIHEGSRLTVPLLNAGKVELSGDGAKFVKLTQLDRDPPAVTLEALPSGTKQESSFQLKLLYTDGSSESLVFFVVPRGIPSNDRSVLPHFAVTS